MKNFKIKGWIIADAVVTVLALWGIGSYNSLVGMDEEVNGKWANVETQYQRRSDLIPNLVNTVKGYAHSLYQKAGVDNKQSLIDLARESEDAKYQD